MSEYMDQEDLELWLEHADEYPIVIATVREMAAIVYRITDMRDGLPNWDEDSCVFCGAYPPLLAHEADCLYLRAKALRGDS